VRHPPTGVKLDDWVGAPWTPDPLVIGGLVAAVAIYTIGAVRLWRHAGAARGIRPWQALAHGAGLVVIAVALLSPLDRASDVLFSAHMAQHELLMLIAAPLIVIGRPLAAGAWALPRAARTRLSTLAPIGRVLTMPAVALLLHVFTRCVWHLPSAFDAALADERVHAFQHVTFFVTAVLFWWALLHGRYGRIGYGIAVLFVFFTMLQSGLLAAMIGFADHPLYAHGERTAAWGLDALHDQQRAGLVMWIPAGIVMMSIGIAILAAWLGQAERAMRGSAHASLR
jgi:putative membrane protein